MIRVVHTHLNADFLIRGPMIGPGHISLLDYLYLSWQPCRVEADLDPQLGGHLERGHVHLYISSQHQNIEQRFLPFLPTYVKRHLGIIMDIYLLSLSLGVGLAVVYILSRILGLSATARPPLPPGPKGLPVVGNVNDLPKPGILEAHHWLKHNDIYGSFSMRVMAWV